MQPRSAADRLRALLARLPEPLQGGAIHALNRAIRTVRPIKPQPKDLAGRGSSVSDPVGAPVRDEAVIASSDAVLARSRFDVPALYFKACAAARLGRDDSARSIIRLDEQVRVADLRLSPEFLAAVAEEIRRHPSLAYKSSDRATRRGAQTRGLVYPGATRLCELLDMIRGEIDRYAEMDDDYARAAPQRARLSSWAVVYGQGGFQVPHWHRFGWLSGVFYVTGEQGSDGRYAGPLVLGPYGEDERGCNPPWGVREIDPVPGRLVLFPSFTPHCTRPAQTAGERICVAFDVVPEGVVSQG